jgi:hypothetical protein
MLPSCSELMNVVGILGGWIYSIKILLFLVNPFSNTKWKLLLT